MVFFHRCEGCHRRFWSLHDRINCPRCRRTMKLFGIGEPHEEIEEAPTPMEDSGGSSAVRSWKRKVLTWTCNTCKIAMKELKGHIYHKRRKWKCRKCGRVSMQGQS